MINILVILRNSKFKFIKLIIQSILRFIGIDLPKEVVIGDGFILPHNGNGVVIHKDTVIGNNVRIYQQCTIGRADIWNEHPSFDFSGIVIRDDVIICAGAKILTSGSLEIGKGSIIGANSVLLTSTGEYEVWAGVPAVFIKKIT